MLCHWYPPDSCLFLYGWVFLEVFVIATRFIFFLMWLNISWAFRLLMSRFWYKWRSASMHQFQSTNIEIRISVLYYRNQDVRQFCCFLVILRIQRAWVSQRWQGRLAAPNRCSTPGWLLVIWGLGHLRTWCLTGPGSVCVWLTGPVCGWLGDWACHPITCFPQAQSTDVVWCSLCPPGGWSDAGVGIGVLRGTPLLSAN